MSKMTSCKTCGAEMAVSAKACPQCGAKNKKPFYAKWWFWTILVLIVIGIAASGGNKAEKVGELASANTSGVKAPAASVAPTSFGVGDQVALNDIIVTFNGFTESKGANYMTPEAGNVFVLCEFTIENNSASDIAVSSIMSFEAYVDDYSTNISLSALLTDESKKQLDGSVAAGKKMNGVIGYEIPENWKELEIRFTPSFWSGKDITFIAVH